MTVSKRQAGAFAGIITLDGSNVKSRSLGLIFVTAVILPSILLAVLSVRAASREEAFVERQLAITLDAETARAAGLANAEVGRIVDELSAGIDVPAGSSYGEVLRKWKAGTPLVDVPFLLSPRYGILWPPAAATGDAEETFLREEGDFLSDRTTTTILQNIADRYQKEILAQTAGAADRAAVSAGSGSAGGGSADSGALAGNQAPPVYSDSSIAASAASAPDGAAPAAPESRQKALDAFAQSQAVQSEVYQAAAEQGDQLSARVAQPVSRALSNAPAVLPAAVPAPAAASEPPVMYEAAPESEAVSGAAGQPKKASEAAAETTASLSASGQPAPTQAAAAQLAPSQTAPSQPAAQPRLTQSQPSQYVVTSQLLSQIASAGKAGIIPRFTNAGLAFLFWERQADGRIAGCQVAGSLLRSRISAVLDGTTTGSRILTFLDENGMPLAAPPGDTGRDWRRPFVSQEIGETFPRWEVASYLTFPDEISAQARASSLTVWIMVLILFVSVAGGGTLVLTSLNSEVRMARNKSTFVTNVSHELKTPLTSISLFVELLRKGRRTDPEKGRAIPVPHLGRNRAPDAADQQRAGFFLHGTREEALQSRAHGRCSRLPGACGRTEAPFGGPGVRGRLRLLRSRCLRGSGRGGSQADRAQPDFQRGEVFPGAQGDRGGGGA